MGGSWPVGVSGSLIVAQTVVSVGPYALIIRRPGAQRWTSSGEHASPATTSVVAVNSPSSATSTDGGTVTCVTSSSVSAGSGLPGGGRTRVAPVSRAVYSSDTDASKLGEANWRTRLSASMANRSTWPATRWASPEWLTTTPLGRPVEPEV
ncbi:hypothetical protein a10_08575 [Streptomyces acidiscabies]|nr:hypothetical protein a10_08575 [Streptomyces acidiscabies]GAV45531.1 hypothetical protein Saa2_08522 [Streptomyces acidiscabies]